MFKSTQSISVQVDEFLQSEHTHVPSTQIKKQNNFPVLVS